LIKTFVGGGKKILKRKITRHTSSKATLYAALKGIMQSYWQRICC
jgi:hypothetical protein